MLLVSLYKKTQIGYTQYGSFAECSVEDKPVDSMPNVTRVSVEHNAFY